MTAMISGSPGYNPPLRGRLGNVFHNDKANQKQQKKHLQDVAVSSPTKASDDASLLSRPL